MRLNWKAGRSSARASGSNQLRSLASPAMLIFNSTDALTSDSLQAPGARPRHDKVLNRAGRIRKAAERTLALGQRSGLTSRGNLRAVEPFPRKRPREHLPGIEVGYGRGQATRHAPDGAQKGTAGGPGLPGRRLRGP